MDEITQIVRTTPISGIDVEFIKKLNPGRAYEGVETQPEVEALKAFFVESVAANRVPIERAIGVMLGIYGDTIRFAIQKAIKDRFFAMKLDEANDLVKALQYGGLIKKIEEARIEMVKLDEDYKKKASEKGVDQFKAVLQYAADRWGSEEEKKTVKSLVSKIKVERKIKK